jgi:hypothetical protein
MSQVLKRFDRIAHPGGLKSAQKVSNYWTVVSKNWTLASSRILMIMLLSKQIQFWHDNRYELEQEHLKIYSL